MCICICVDMEFEDKERESNYLSNLEKEITRECAAVGVSVTPDLAHHFIKLKELNPRNEFTASEIMPRARLQDFVHACVKDLAQQTPPMDCLRMQSYWRSAVPKLADEVKDSYHSFLMEKAEAAFQEVLQAEDRDKLMKKIAAFANLYTNATGMNTTQNLRETINPLKSVFKHQDLVFFTDLSEFGKFEYLKITARLVSGIRIYQHYYKKGSESLDSAPLLLPVAVAAIKSDLQNWLERIRKRSSAITKELVYLLDALEWGDRPVLPEGFGEDDVEELKKILVVMIQHEAYLKELLEIVDEFGELVHNLLTAFTNAMEVLNEIIDARNVIPTVEVFDKFIAVADYWSELHAEGCQLLYMGVINKNMHNVNPYFYHTPLEAAMDWDAVEQYEQDITRKIVSQTYAQDDAEHGEDVCVASLPEDEVLEFRGFCAECLYRRGGFLSPARSELGTVQFEGKWYGFCSADHGEQWQQEPRLNLYRAYDFVRCNPELVTLLGMYDLLYSYRNDDLVARTSEAEHGARDAHVQTILHPVPEYIDKDYTFSTWQLKFRALQLSRIVKCLTKSAQTVDHSHFRASIGIQCAPDKSEETSTKRDAASVHETVLNYMWGLRDADGDRFKVLSLSRPVDETYLRVLPAGDGPCADRPCPREKGDSPCARPARKDKSRKTKATRLKELVAGAERGKFDYLDVMAEVHRIYSFD